MNVVFPPSAGPARPRALLDPSRFQGGLFVLAAFLGTAGLWLLLGDLLRAGPIGFPPDRPSVTPGKVAAGAYRVAQRGMIRGDLWADAAFADAAALALPERSGPLDRASAVRLDRARSAMETSLSLAPIDAGGWLLLATLPLPSGGVDRRVASLLKMAYLTAQNDIALAPRRVERAAASSALSDPEIQEFVKADIRRLLAGTPEQRSTLVTAYRNSLPENRAPLESLVADVDSGFARTLRSSAQR